MINLRHITFSKSGGAGNVASQLYKYQKQMHDYNVFFDFVIDSSLWESPFEQKILLLRAIFDQYIVKNRNVDSLISLYRKKSNSYMGLNLNDIFEIVHLHWVEGVINNNGLDKLISSNRPKVWTIHDMAPFTGGCHYSLGCNGYLDTCNECPMVRKSFQAKVQDQKKIQISRFLSAKNLTLVFPTKRFMDKFSKTPGFQKLNTAVVENPVSEVFFENFDDVQSDEFIIGFVSSQLQNPIKNYEKLKKLISIALNGSNIKIKILAIGHNGRTPRVFWLNDNILIQETGVIQHTQELAINDAKMNLLVSISKEESFGMSIAESSVIGVPSLILGENASSDLVEEGVNGWVVKSEKDFIIKIIELVNSKNHRIISNHEIKKFAAKRWSVSNIAQKYENIYKLLIHNI